MLRRGIDIFAKAGSPVIAVQDGKIVKVGNTKRLGNFVMLRDVYGNTYTYAGLKKVASQVPVPKAESQARSRSPRSSSLPTEETAPTEAASAGSTRRPAS